MPGMAVQWSTALSFESQKMFKPGAAVLDIGSSNVYMADADGVAGFIKRYAGQLPLDVDAHARDIATRSCAMAAGQQQNKAFLGEILTASGMKYESVDIANGYRTTLLDLNQATAPTQFINAFDLVMNVGTSEHILNQANVFAFVHDTAKPGGLMFHQLPAAGFANHGYFCYTARLFCDMAGYNGYAIESMWFDGPSQHENLLGAVNDYRKIYPALDRLLTGTAGSERDARVAATLIPEMSINVLYRKMRDTRFLGTLETSTSVGRIEAGTLDTYGSGIADRAVRRAKFALKNALAGHPEIARFARRLAGR
jgi:SAM-dependent methyltransferase